VGFVIVSYLQSK